MNDTLQATPEVKSANPQTSQVLINHQKKPFSHQLILICGIIALLLIGFIGGQAFERARIRHFTRWQNNYQQNFFGERERTPRDMMFNGNMMGAPFRSHAVLGTILSINSNSVSIQDNDGNVEQAISISNSTVIQNGNGRGSVSDLRQGQRIAIFGRPTNDGKIGATLIRILDKTSPSPAISTSPTPSKQPLK